MLCCCENPREGVPLLWANKLNIIQTSKIIDMKRFTPHKNIKRHVRALKIFPIHNTMSVTQKQRFENFYSSKKVVAQNVHNMVLFICVISNLRHY